MRFFALTHQSVTLATVVAVSMTLASGVSRSQAVLFFDDFDGTILNPSFQAALPNAGAQTYVGAPNYAFQSIGGASVLRLANTMSNLQRIGWSTSSVFSVTDFRLEIRFNTLTQGPGSSIDGFVQLMILDAADPNRQDYAKPFSAQFGSDRRFVATSLIGNEGIDVPFNYLNNAWYRLALEASATANVRASIYADDGTTELIGYTFSHNGTAFPSGFRLGLAQEMGFPNAPSPTDVAVDWMRLTTVPEPSSIALCCAAVVALGVRARRRRVPSAAVGFEDLTAAL